MHFQWKGGYHPLRVPTDLDGLPYPGEGIWNHMIILFLRSDRKGWDKDYQDPLHSEFRRFSSRVMKTGRG